MKEIINSIPILGNGIGFRPELKPFIFLNRDKIGFLEVIADHYIDVPEAKLRELDLLKDHFTIIPHGIGLSLGTAQGLNREYVRKLSALIRRIDPPYWSEHISYTQAHSYHIGHLAPIVYNQEFLEVMQTNITCVKNEIGQPLILENITYHVDLPGREMDDAEFLNTLTNLTGCGLLLDLTNLFINSFNFGFDPYAFLNKIDSSKIIQLHYVGFEEETRPVTDAHASATQPEIFALMEYLFSKHVPKADLLERDDRYEFQQEILADLLRAREMRQNYSS